jgi:hypothetical protein
MFRDLALLPSSGDWLQLYCELSNYHVLNSHSVGPYDRNKGVSVTLVRYILSKRNLHIFWI